MHRAGQTYYLDEPTVLKFESLNLLETSRPVQACTGIAVPLPNVTKCARVCVCVRAHVRACGCVCARAYVSPFQALNVWRICRILGIKMMVLRLTNNKNSVYVEAC